MDSPKLISELVLSDQQLAARPEASKNNGERIECSKLSAIKIKLQR